MSSSVPASDGQSTQELVETLQRAATAHEEAQKRVEEGGQERLEELQKFYDELLELFDRYEERATGDGDFGVFIEFQEKIANFVERLPEDLDHRDRFEEVDEILHQRRLTESDFEAARNELAPVADLVERLDERERTRERYQAARHDVAVRKRELEAEISEREELVALGEADLKAPIERLREPIETYNRTIEDVFREFKRETPASEVLSFVETTESYPLVAYRQPPDDLATYVERSEAGDESILTLLEYAEYSVSKLEHYVPNARELKRNVATHQTYLRRIDAGPLQIEWPPAEATTLWWRCRELIAVVGRIAPEDVVTKLRTVRDLPRETDYERLRESARARDQLDDDERERLASGAVADELSTLRQRRETLIEALSEYPER
ncbi:DUF7118 family protein [Halorhabdus rudnickae]|uniref:DUF7118 family protein n=1 Tax=Halorhabdus rudnickae TaxID=1775544 RepID=UPI00108313D7|nr:hypothetical protein [Halorhabdus rudnickae]